MLIYIGTPLTAVGLWKRDDINRVEASLYRKIMRIGNDIPNRAILNTMTNIRLAGDVVYYLSREAQNEYRRQHRVTQYFDKIEGNQTVATNDNVNAATNNVANSDPLDPRRDVDMSAPDGRNHTNAANATYGD